MNQLERLKRLGLEHLANEKEALLAALEILLEEAECTRAHHFAHECKEMIREKTAEVISPSQGPFSKGSVRKTSEIERG